MGGVECMVSFSGRIFLRFMNVFILRVCRVVVSRSWCEIIWSWRSGCCRWRRRLGGCSSCRCVLVSSFVVRWRSWLLRFRGFGLKISGFVRRIRCGIERVVVVMRSWVFRGVF